MDDRKDRLLDPPETVWDLGPGVDGELVSQELGRAVPLTTKKKIYV